MSGFIGYDLDETMDYIGFVEQRHRVWEKRQLGSPQPWTTDPIVRFHKFTNVFRVLDPGSQYAVALGNEEGDSPATVLGRLFMYRYTNIPAMWDHLLESWGSWPDAGDLTGRTNELFQLLDGYHKAGHNVFTGAYVVSPISGKKGDTKLEQVLQLTARVVGQSTKAFTKAKTLEEQYNVLREHRGVGAFMAMQIVTDWGYSQYGADTEETFVAAGPGSTRGAKLVAPKAKPEAVIREMAEWWRRGTTAGTVRLRLPNGTYRYPSLMDIQNTFCEYSKYARYRRRGGLNDDRSYKPQHPGPQPEPVYPRSWL